jgi:DNA invertase Pin-like site-specific DNA recombinase
VSLAKDVLAALKDLIVLREKVDRLAQNVTTLSSELKTVTERLIRLETKLDIYERLASRRRLSE